MFGKSQPLSISPLLILTSLDLTQPTRPHLSRYSDIRSTFPPLDWQLLSISTLAGRRSLLKPVDSSNTNQRVPYCQQFQFSVSISRQRTHFHTSSSEPVSQVVAITGAILRAEALTIPPSLVLTCRGLA